MSLLEREQVAMTPDNIRSRKLPLIANVVIAVAAVALAAVIVYGAGIGNWVLVAVLGGVFYLVGLFAAANSGTVRHERAH